MRRISLTIISALIFLFPGYSQDANDVKAVLLWKSDKVFDIPESVLLDKENNVLYVSNINGNPTDLDENGYISKMTPNGRVLIKKWTSGLNAPKGMGKFGNVLYVTDINRLVEIDIPSGRILKYIPVENSKFLNDIAIDDAGNVYISDMQDQVIYKYDGQSVSEWMRDNVLINPNGLYERNGTLYIGVNGRILKADLKNGGYKILVEETGSIDGLNMDKEGNFIISDWRGKVQYVTLPGQMITLFDTSSDRINAADIFLDVENSILYVPTFVDGRVMAYRIGVLN